jgi:hypothetical protein
MPDEAQFLCGDWVWDAALRELRHYERRKKGHAEEPDAVERLEPAKSVTLYQWSQQPMQTATGQISTGRLSRVVVEYADGRKLDINEDDRECAHQLAEAVAGAYGLAVAYEGAPTGRRGGNLPQHDNMGRLVYREGRLETVLDQAAGVLQTTRKGRFFGKERREYRTADVRRLELRRELAGPNETISVEAVVGPDEERVRVAGHSGFEGWAEIGEWREFTAEVAGTLSVDWSDLTMS